MNKSPQELALEAYLAGLTDKKARCSDNRFIAVNSWTKEQLEKRANANRNKVNDPDWIKAHKEGGAKRRADPKWQENVKKALQDRAKDPDWLEKNKRVLQDRAKDPDWIKKHAEGMKKKFDNPEYVKKHADAQAKKALNPEFKKKFKSIAYKPLITPYGVFASITLAGAAEEELTGKRFNPNLFTKRLKDPDSGYKRISKEEYIMLTGKEL